MTPYDPEEITAVPDRFAGCISVRFDNYPPPAEITKQAPPQPALRRYVGGAIEEAAVANKARHAARRAEVKASVCLMAIDGEHDFRTWSKNRAGVTRMRCPLCKVSYSDQ